MKLFKKARELFQRLKGDDVPPGPRPPPTPSADPFLPVFFEELPAYQQAQRDFQARAKAVTVISTGRTLNRGSNKNKRAGRAWLVKCGFSPRWAKRRQRTGIVTTVTA